MGSEHKIVQISSHVTSVVGGVGIVGLCSCGWLGSAEATTRGSPPMPSLTFGTRIMEQRAPSGVVDSASAIQIPAEGRRRRGLPRSIRRSLSPVLQSGPRQKDDAPARGCTGLVRTAAAEQQGAGN